jgi:hypothetical protein
MAQEEGAPIEPSVEAIDGGGKGALLHSLSRPESTAPRERALVMDDGERAGRSANAGGKVGPSWRADAGPPSLSSASQRSPGIPVVR